MAENLKYKMIFCDLDDTLIRTDGVPGAKTKEAIKRYEAAGGKFIIATGRMTSGTKKVCRELDLHGEIITFQGAVVSDIDSGKVLSSTVISNNDAVEIGRFIESRGYYYQTYAGDVFITQTATEYTRLYSELSNAGYIETAVALSDYIKENNVSPPKILLMDASSRIQEILDDLRLHFGGDFLINTSKPFIIEIVPKSINKGIAVLRLAEDYRILAEEIICIGDSENDIPMLRVAGLPIVVENGTAIAKNNAKIVCPSCDDDGVAYIIEKVLASEIEKMPATEI